MARLSRDAAERLARALKAGGKLARDANTEDVTTIIAALQGAERFGADTAIKANAGAQSSSPTASFTEKKGTSDMASSSRLIAEMKRVYGTPENVLRRLALDERLLDEGERDMKYTRDRGFTRARRAGDEEESVVDRIAQMIAECPPEEEEELHHAMREIAEDYRDHGGHRRWAKDRLERGGYDVRRRQARDLSAEELGRNEPLAGNGRRFAGNGADFAGNQK